MYLNVLLRLHVSAAVLDTLLILGDAIDLKLTIKKFTAGADCFLSPRRQGDG